MDGLFYCKNEVLSMMAKNLLFKISLLNILTKVV